MSFATSPDGEVSMEAPGLQLVNMPEPVLNVPPDEARWLVWGRSVFAVAVVVALIALGVANVARYSRWHEVEDGVFWGARAEGVTAVEVAAGSAAAAAGDD